MIRRPWDVEPDPVELERARARDKLADVVELRRRQWHAARTERETAYRLLHQAERAEIMCEQNYRSAVAEYEAQK